MRLFRYYKETFLSALLGIAALLFFSYSCSTPSKVADEKWNLSAIYNPTKSTLHPSYKVFHNSDESSLLYLKVYTSELFFQPAGQKGAVVSEISVQYTLNETDGSSLSMVDTGNFNYTIHKENTGQYFLSQIPLKTEMGKSYRLKVIMRDKLKKTFNLSFIDIEKKPETGEQFFNVTSTDGIPVFKNLVVGNNAIRINHSAVTSGKLYISYYQNNTPTPKPTYSISDEVSTYGKYDSLFIVDYSPATALSLSYEGMYFIQFDTNSAEGVAVTRFNDGFPKVVNPEDLIPPLFYITTLPEYQELETNSNKKIAADNFWLKTAGNTDRAREMIRIYYNRVYFANFYFTNTRPGWKTDRGMVYIVFGAPQNIKKTPGGETWYYFLDNNSEIISFTFIYSPNKFGINQFVLDRSENHEWNWQEAIYSWTNGKIFLLD